MKQIWSLIIILIIGSITFISCSSDEQKIHAGAQSEQQQSQKDYYTCPMHPSVISDRPGACPVCGMALVKKSPQQEMASEEMENIYAVSLSPTQRVLANVATEPVFRRALSREIEAVGVVDIAEPLQATVSARFRGRIEKLFVNYTGEQVKKGQPLFEMYSPDLITGKREFLLAIDALSAAKEAGIEQNIRMQEGLLRAIRDRLHIHFGMTDEQIAELESGGRVSNTVRFLSPIAGTVIRKQALEGQYVDEGMALYELADLSTVWMYLDVYEKDARFIRINQPLQITTEAYPGETFSGRAVFIDPVMNSETRTFRIRAEFSNPHLRLKPRMYVRAQIKVSLGRPLVIPASAVISTGKRTVVWVEVKPNVFEPRDVVLGSTSDLYYEVISGLMEGDEIAVSGGYLIDSESQLRLPAARDAHAGHGVTTQASEESRITGRGSSVSGQTAANEIHILVKGRYKPDVIRIKQGKPVRLLFYRDEDADCTNEVVFDDFKIRKRLPARKTTTIEIPPTKPGEYHFTCGMGMVSGKLVVE